MELLSPKLDFFLYFRRKLAKPETYSYLTFFIRNFYVVINKLSLL